jgi:hypothetical protein
MPNLTQLVFRLPASDLQRSIGFYVGVLGFELLYGPDPTNGYDAVGLHGAARIALDPRPGGRTAGRADAGGSPTPPAIEITAARLINCTASQRVRRQRPAAGRLSERPGETAS